MLNKIIHITKLDKKHAQIFVFKGVEQVYQPGRSGGLRRRGASGHPHRLLFKQHNWKIDNIGAS